MSDYIPLTNNEMKLVTGAGTKDRMIQVLKDSRIPYWLRADGWPTTTYQVINASLLGKSGAGEKQVTPVENVIGFDLKAAG